MTVFWLSLKSHGTIFRWTFGWSRRLLSDGMTFGTEPSDINGVVINPNRTIVLGISI